MRKHATRWKPKRILALLLCVPMLCGMLAGQEARAAESGVTESGGVEQSIEERTVAHFPLNAEYKLKNRKNMAQAFPDSAASNAGWKSEYVELHRANGGSNPNNTGHIAGNYPGDAVTGKQVSFSVDVRVDGNQSRTPSAQEAPLRTIFLYGGKTDYNKDCISIRYFYNEDTSAVVLKQSGKDAVVAEFPRPLADMWHNYAVSLDGEENGKLTVWVDGEEAASADSQGIGAEEIGSQVMRMNRATASNTINVDARYRDVRILKGLLSDEDARWLAEEIQDFTWQDLSAGQQTVYEGMTVRSDLKLAYGSGLMWESSDPGVIDGTTGKVNRPAQGQPAKEVTLAITWKGSRKEYRVLVLAQGENVDAVTMEKPSISPAGGTETDPQDIFQKVTLSHPAGNEVIYYTTDGSTPTQESNPYTGPFSVEGHTHLKAAAITEGGNRSEVADAWMYGSKWAPTAVEFRLEDENTVNNAKISWPEFPGADAYEVYLDGVLIGTVSGDLMDDYGLALDETYTYTVKALAEGVVLAEGETNPVSTFTVNPDEVISSYNNNEGRNETYITSDTSSPSGIRIGDKYYSYRYAQVPEEVCGYGSYSSENKDGYRVMGIYERVSEDGIHWPAASEDRLLYPYFVDLRLEGAGYTLHPDGETVIFSGHAEGTTGYGAAKLFLASFKPGRTGGSVEPYCVEVAGGKIIPVASALEQQEMVEEPGENQLGSYYVGRPMSYDSHDMVLFTEEKDAYVISAVNNNSNTAIIKLNDTWTAPEKLMQIAFRGKSQESPAIIKGEDGKYYFFASTANGWLPSQARYASTTALDQPWSPLRPIANSSSYSSQANGIWTLEGSSGRTMYRGHGYHWGGQFGDRHYDRFWPTAINEGIATGSWFGRIDYHPVYGGIAVQSGKYLSLGKTAVAEDTDTADLDAGMVTDGRELQTSPKLDAVDKLPYSVTVDLEEPCVLSEISFATGLVVGSTALTSYTMEGSLDGSDWTLLVDGRDNGSPGFVSDRIEDNEPYRYVRMTVDKVTNMNNNQSALWAGKLIELAVYGREASSQEKEHSVSLEDIRNVANVPGTQITVPVTVKGLGDGIYSSVESVYQIPEGLRVVSVESSENISGGTVNYTAEVGEDGKLYVAFVDTEPNPGEDGSISQRNEEDPAFYLKLELEEAREPGSILQVTLESFLAKQKLAGTSDESPNNYEATKFELIKASASIHFSAGDPKEMTAEASVLYIGDGQELIPENRKAIGVVFTNVKPGTDIRLGDTKLYYSPQRSERNGTIAYVGLVDSSVNVEGLCVTGNEAVNAVYTMSGGAGESILFADTNDDGLINAADALNVLDSWLRNAAAEGDRDILTQNVTGDGRIDTRDVLSIVDHFVDGKGFEVIAK